MTDDARDRDLALSQALHQMGHALVPVEDSERVASRRERLVGALTSYSDGVFERDRKRTLRGGLVAGFAVAAAVAGVLGVRALSGARAGAAAVRVTAGSVLVAHEGAAGGAVDRVPLDLATRDHVQTREGTAEVSLVSGAIVELDPMSDLALAEADRTSSAIDERVRLGSGKIHVKVPKLSPGSRLVVATPNATVTVHGTAFVVEVVPAAGTAPASTRVSVTEGRVSVASGEREIFLDPGATWSSSGATAAEPTSATATPLSELPLGAPEPRPEPAPKSTLAAENALFREALLARTNGDPERTIRLIDDLLGKYPSSPLVGEARAERRRARLDVERRHGPSTPP